MKTEKEIESLKHDWSIDPCWDIEETEGFEDHKEELIIYRKKMESRWEQRVVERERKEMEKMGLTDKAVYNQIKRLEFIINRLDERVEELEDR